MLLTLPTNVGWRAESTLEGFEPAIFRPPCEDATNYTTPPPLYKYVCNVKRNQYSYLALPWDDGVEVGLHVARVGEGRVGHLTPELLEGHVFGDVGVQGGQVVEVLHTVTQPADLKVLVGERRQVPRRQLACHWRNKNDIKNLSECLILVGKPANR